MMPGNKKLGQRQSGAPARPGWRERAACGDFPQPVTRVKPVKKFFIWIRRNPLKSTDSTKGIQGNARLFPWFSLDSFGFNSRAG
jgi:hypothetical protein